MNVSVLVLDSFNNQPILRQIYKFTRVPGIGEKISLPEPHGAVLIFQVIDVEHLSLQDISNGSFEAKILVRRI